MVMSLRSKVDQKRLEQLEKDFEHTLISCLRECARGRWGLFGQNDLADPEHKYWRWPEADQLRADAAAIQRLSSEFGKSNSLCDRFELYCRMRGPNVPGEPKLATKFLDEIGAREAQDQASPLL
jgi:hypothetical protein